MSSHSSHLPMLASNVSTREMFCENLLDQYIIVVPNPALSVPVTPVTMVEEFTSKGTKAREAESRFALQIIIPLPGTHSCLADL